MNQNADEMMEVDQPESGKGGRLRKSCEACRNSKGKCGPSEEVGRCLKCLKEGKDCIFLEAKPRPKRAKGSKTRVAEMEEKVETLLALLSEKVAKATSPSDAPAVPPESSSTSSHPSGLTPPVLATPSIVSRTPSSISVASGFGTSTKAFHFPVFTFPTSDLFDDPISRGVIDYSQAKECLRLFHAKRHSFPFINVPSHMTLDTLRRQRPFLLLSILTFGTDSNVTLQNQLDAELRENLARRVMINGEKSLDVLQGVLLYLIWYHYYFDTVREQIYQLSQMAAAMACNLEINKQSKVIASNAFSVTNTSYSFQLCSEELEERRTFLGCYYLTSWVSLGLRKPHSLKWSEYLEECAHSLANAGEVDTDYLLGYYVRFQHLAEEVNEAFAYDSTLTASQSETSRIDFLMRGFEQQLNQFQITAPPQIWTNVHLMMSYLSLRVYVNEVAFHSSPPPENNAMFPSPQSWHNSTNRNECFIRCLQACKSFLDYFLALPHTKILDFTLPEYGRLIYVAMVFGSFPTHCNTPTLDAAHIKEMSNLQYYVNGLCDKTSYILANLRAEGSNPYFRYLNMMFEQTKIWSNHMGGADGKRICQTAALHFSFLDIMNTVKDMCAMDTPELSIGMSDAGSVSDGQWDELMAGWSASTFDGNIQMNNS